MSSKLADLSRALNMTQPELARIAYYTDRYLFPGDISGEQVLEIGGGNGAIALYLAVERGARVDVLDEYRGHGSASTNYDLLLSRCEALGVAVQVIKGDVRVAELAESTYDHAFARNAFHHIHSRSDSDTEVVATLGRISRWLKGGAWLTLGEASWVSVARFLPPLRKRVFKDFQFASKSTAGRWGRCAERAGFQVEGIGWYTPYGLRFARLLLGNRLANAFLTSAYVVRFRKGHVI